MNPGVLSVRKSRVVFVAMAIVLCGGVVAYKQMGRLEDPEFTIKEALIITPYPGASAEEVAQEVTNPIETACQQLGQLERVESESTRGRSVVSAIIKDRYDKHRIPQVWDELRRKVADVQSQLPPAVRGQSIVVDDFGDVYGIFLAITGDGYSQAELRRYADFLRREMLLVPNVQKVELFGQQQEVVFLEISRQRLAQLGINEEQIYSKLQAKNVAPTVAACGSATSTSRSIRKANSIGRRYAWLGDRLRPVRPPTFPQGCRDVGARRSRPAAAFAPVRR